MKTYTEKELKKILKNERKKLISEEKSKTKKQKESKKKTPTQAYYHSIFKKMKLMWTQGSPERRTCLNNSLKIDSSGLKKYKCNSCKKYFSYSDINIDHIDPIGGEHPNNLDECIEYFKRLNFPYEKLQVLCKKVCHKNKSKKDIKNIKEKKNNDT